MAASAQMRHVIAMKVNHGLGERVWSRVTSADERNGQPCAPSEAREARPGAAQTREGTSAQVMNATATHQLKTDRRQIDAAVKLLDQMASTIQAGQRLDPILVRTATNFLRAYAARLQRGRARTPRKLLTGSFRRELDDGQEAGLRLADFIPGLAGALRTAAQPAAGLAVYPRAALGLDGLGFQASLTPPPLADRNYAD